LRCSIIFESDPIRRAALYYFLRRLGVATEVRIDLKVAAEASLIEHSSNSPGDWAERGMLLTQQQQWEGAAHCFSQVDGFPGSVDLSLWICGCDVVVASCWLVTRHMHAQ
jgi:hypothetical protein